MEEKISSVKLVPVTNRDNGLVCLKLSNNKLIEFNPGQTRKVSIDDLIEANSSTGNRVILRDYLVVQDKEALDILEMEPEPEYFYSEKEVRKLLAEGTIEQLEDCLNFAPGGVIDLLKEIAVETKLPDMRKRELIAKKTGFNLDNILLVKKQLEAETEKPKEDKEKNSRKAEPISAESGSKRKAEPIKTTETKNYPKYNVVSVEK